ncbi:hypothetical protein T07_9580 [Trichinella nelsoni]|uniref:Uncharacterized protein n=1 Tax=Trichinella nelsoni TaxID=6336 RepID=A0A0V0RB84_9BILA|nr:hypothetical protein T07_9580 [Trichinella nelsoni]
MENKKRSGSRAKEKAQLLPGIRQCEVISIHEL